MLNLDVEKQPDSPLYISDGLWNGIRVQEFFLTSGAIPENEMPHHHLTVNLGTTGYAHHKEYGKWNTTRYDFGAVGLIPAEQLNEPRWNFNSRILTIDLENDAAYGSNYLPKRGIIDTDITNIALALSWELKKGAAASKLLGDVAAIALKGLLADKYAAVNFRKRSAYSGLSGGQLARVMDFCCSNLSENISLSQLASLCNLSSFHFLRQFKRSCGVSPYQFFNELKMAEAGYKLLKTDVTISELSFQLGYAHQGHFSKAFKQYTGISPKEYRLNRK